MCYLLLACKDNFDGASKQEKNQYAKNDRNFGFYFSPAYFV